MTRIMNAAVKCRTSEVIEANALHNRARLSLAIGKYAITAQVEKTGRFDPH